MSPKKKCVQFIYDKIIYKLKRYKSRSDLYLFTGAKNADIKIVVGERFANTKNNDIVVMNVLVCVHTDAEIVMVQVFANTDV